MSSKIGQFFNPSEHLVFHQDKEGNMIGGGYHVNNMLYQHKMPLFVSYNEAPMTGGSGGHDDGDENKHFIPEKFSDLFRDLAVPAGLFMMPALFRPRNYAASVREEDTEPKADEAAEAKASEPEKDADSDADAESDDSDDETERRKPVPNDIFDTLLSLVAPNERIQHDVKTRRNKGGDVKKRQNKTRRGGER
jgi:hypothetical protein